MQQNGLQEKPQQQIINNPYQQRLGQKMLTALLLLSLLPLILIGIRSYTSTRNLLRQQINQQVGEIAREESAQVQQFAHAHQDTIDRLVTDAAFQSNLLTLTEISRESEENLLAQEEISRLMDATWQSGSSARPDLAIILSANGEILLASSADWVRQNLGEGRIAQPFIRSLLGTNRSLFGFETVPGYSKQLALYTSRSFVDAQGSLSATLITITPLDAAVTLLANHSTQFMGAESFFFNAQGELIGAGAAANTLQIKTNVVLSTALTPLVGEQRAQSLFASRDTNNVRIIVYAIWLPDEQLGILASASEDAALAPNKIVDPLLGALFVLALAAFGGLVYFSRTWLALPVAQLAQAAAQFSAGNWEVRSRYTRKDDIGVIARTFNYMAGELSSHYHFFDQVMQERTRLLQTAAEVVQDATTARGFAETLQQTLQQMVERFHLYHAAVFILDAASQKLVLWEASGTAAQQVKDRNSWFELDGVSLIGQAAATQQVQNLTRKQQDVLFYQDPLLPEKQSELAVPIMLGDETIGVLDLQAVEANAFEEENILVFQILANHIANVIQSMRLLDASQVSYPEAELLYRATRLISQARSEAEVSQYLSDILNELPFTCALISRQGDHFLVGTVTSPKTGKTEKEPGSNTIPVGQMDTLLREKRMALVEDIAQPNDFADLLAFLQSFSCRAAALVPVLQNGRLTKVLVFGSPASSAISAISLQLYGSLAETAGSTLDKISVLSTLQMRLAELQILASFSQAITAETDLNNLYRVLHQQIIQTFGPDLEFAVALYNEADNIIEFPYFYEQGQKIEIPGFPLGEGLTSTLISQQKPMLLQNEASIRAYNAKIIGKAAKSWMGAPLMFIGKVIGAVILQDLETEERFTQHDLNLIATLASQIAIAVRNTQLYTETQQALRAFDQEHFLLNTLLDYIPEEVSFKDSDGRYIRASESLAKIYQTTASSMIGKTDYDLLDPATADRISQAEQALMAENRSEVGVIEERQDAQGNFQWIYTARIPFRIRSGDTYGLLTIHRDISELKHAEELAQHRAEQMTIAAEIARDSTGTLEVQPLLQKAIDLIYERFGFYHASVFLLDSAGEYAVLRVSTGEAGQKMLLTGHRLAVGSKSIVGQVAATGSALIVNNVQIDPTHLPHPLLPDTRSELAIPLKVGERVLGALDVQSKLVNAFRAEEDLNVLQILADQLAVAVVNGQLFAKTQDLLAKHRLLRQVAVAASASSSLEDALTNTVHGLRTAMLSDHIAVLLVNSDQMLQVHASAGYEGTRHREIRIAPGEGITGQAAAEKRVIRVDDISTDLRYIQVDPDIRSELAIPILYNEELLGVLNLESHQVAAFDENDEEIMGSLGSNLGSIIANFRLVSQIRQQVIRERQLFDVTSKIRRTVDLETILQTSTEEITRTLGARRAKIRITAGETTIVENQSATGSKPDSGYGNNGKASHDIDSQEGGK